MICRLKNLWESKILNHFGFTTAEFYICTDHLQSWCESQSIFIPSQNYPKRRCTHIQRSRTGLVSRPQGCACAQSNNRETFSFLASTKLRLSAPAYSHFCSSIRCCLASYRLEPRIRFKREEFNALFCPLMICHWNNRTSQDWGKFVIICTWLPDNFESQ